MQKQIIQFSKLLFRCLLPFTLFLLLLLPRVSLASYEISDGSVKGLWHEEDNIDSSGNGKNFTVTGGSYETAKFSNGYKMTSGQGYNQVISDNLGITGATSTYCGWVKLNADIGTGASQLWDQVDSTTKVIFTVQYEYNSGTRRVWFYRQKNGVSNDGYAYNINLGTTQHFICLTYDGSNIRGYIDGSLVGSPTSSSGNGSSAISSEVKVGNSYVPNSNITWIIDDFFITNKALTATSVSDIWNSGTGQEICVTAGCADATTSTSCLNS